MTNWFDNLERNVHGRVKDTIMNLNSILMHDAELEGIAYNTQTRRVMVRNKMPWGTEKTYFNDMDEACLKSFIAAKYGAEIMRTKTGFK